MAKNCLKKLSYVKIIWLKRVKIIKSFFVVVKVSILEEGLD